MNITDIVVILLIVIVAVISARKGFIKAVFNIITYIISGFLVKLFSAPVSSFIYDNFVSEKVMTELNNILPTGSVEGEIFVTIENVLNSLPEYITSIGKQFGIYPESSQFKDFAERYDAFSIESIEQSFISPIVTGVISVIVMIVMFILFTIILKIVFSFINKLITNKNHKILRSTNAFFGAALGVVKGTVLAGVVCAVLNVLAPIIGNATLTDLTVNSYFCNLIADLLK